MSYTILYRSMFAKVGDDKYIPMIEIGSNNVYVVYGSKQKRDRNWQSWSIPNHENRVLFTQQEIMDGVYSLIEETAKRYVNTPARDWDNIPGPYWTYKDVYKNYGWLSAIAVYGKETSDTTARMVENFFKRGFQQAIDFRIPFWQFKMPMYLKYSFGIEEKRKFFDTLEDFLQVIKDGNLPKDCCVGYDNSTMDFVWENHRNRRNR